MKKVISIFVALFMFVMLTNVVSATDLTSQIKVSGEGLTFTKKYDATKDITNIVATVLVSEENIDTILSQTAGEGSVLADYYFELNPNLTGTTFKKYNNWYASTLTHKTVEEAIATLKTKMETDTVSTYSTVWPLAVMVEYYDGTAWVKSDTAGTGSLSIGQDLANKLGKAQNELIYGEDFRFSMYDEYTAVYGWDILKDDGTSEGKYEFVTVDYEIKFPVSGKNGTEQVAYSSIKAAIEDGKTEITVNESINVKEDLVIPKGVTVIIANNSVVTMVGGAKFTNNGDIIGKVVVDGKVVKYSNIIIEPTVNGTLTADRKTAAPGDKVTITVTPNEGYSIETVKVLGSIDIVDNKDGTHTITMQESDLTLSATFAKTEVKEETKVEIKEESKVEIKEETKKDETPKTGAIPVIAIIAVVSLVGLVFIKKERKMDF